MHRPFGEILIRTAMSISLDMMPSSCSGIVLTPISTVKDIKRYTSGSGSNTIIHFV